MRSRALRLLLTAAVAATSGCAGPTAEAPLPAAPGELLAGRWRHREDLHDELERFYEGHRGERAWDLGARAQPQADTLVARLAAAEELGLVPSDYEATRLAAWVRARRADRRHEDTLEVDARLTAAALLYASDLSSGRLDPDGDAPARQVAPHRRPLAGELAAALARRELDTWLDALEPRSELYRGQLALLERYRRIVASGGWPRVPAGPSLALGEPIERDRLFALLERLAAEGDLAALDRAILERLQATRDGGADGLRYHRRLAAAVRRFQERHGLDPDGRLGPETAAALEVTARERVRRILLNLERARWMERDLPERYLHVNVPAFTLEARTQGETALAMPIVAGRTDWMTPLLLEELVAVELNPYWNVPASIANEVIAEAAGDLDAFLAKGYEVLAGWGEAAEAVDPRTVDWTRLAADEASALRFRQAPGPTNALGSIKFSLPNRHNVYLHDTPARASFARSDRALSHGCIRVAAPLDLAAWVLAGQDGWDRARLAAAMASGAPTTIRLEHALPVYILYWTAWMAEDGKAQFRDDVYGLDTALAARFTAGGGRRTAR